MKIGNWKVIENKLQTKIKEIFSGIDIDELSDYEKRKIIFDYLVGHLDYDYSLLGKINETEKLIKEGTIKKRKEFLVREPYLEFESVLDNNIGICNGISQYYKMLLEQVGVIAHCVICDDGTDIKHQLTLVYDSDKNIYSFDDVTSVIVGRGDKDTYFDYDEERANSLNQGTKELIKDDKWVILDDEYISALLGRDYSMYESISKLPSNLKSVKESGFHY